MNTTTDPSFINHFSRLPDELLEKIFFLTNYPLLLTPNNHAPPELNSYYFDYSIQQPLLKQTHVELLRVSLVCRRFYQIIKSCHFWERKCRQEHVLLPNQHLPADFTAYEKLFVNNPFHPAFNLLHDNNWKKSENTKSQIELIPIGSHRLYDEFNRLSPCRVTSYVLGKFSQRDVQLPRRGSNFNDFVDLRPIIEFSICVAARWDCGSRCSISLLFSDEHHWEYEKTLPQWNDRKWYRLVYRYAEYEQFPSSVNVYLTGSDTQAWAGFYGIKFAQARLRLLLRTNENAKNEESEVIIEPTAEDEVVQGSEPDPEPLPDDLSTDEKLSASSYSYRYSHTDEDSDT